MKEWLTSSEIAAARLPDLPQTRQGVELMIAQSGWRSTSNARPRAGRGGGYEYHFLSCRRPHRSVFAPRRMRPDGKRRAPGRTCFGRASTPFQRRRRPFANGA